MARPGRKKHTPTSETVSVCSHRQEVVIEDVPYFEYACHKCGKGFKHKNYLLEHMSCHSKRFCVCAYPCPPFKAPKGIFLEVPTSMISKDEPKIGPSKQNHNEYDNEDHKSDNKQTPDNEEVNKKDDFAFAYTCNDCGNGFPQKSNLSIHRRSHNKGNNTKSSATCVRCKKSYQNKQELSYHVNKEHEGNSAYSCNKCNDKFVTSKGLKEHVLKTHFAKDTKKKILRGQQLPTM